MKKIFVLPLISLAYVSLILTEASAQAPLVNIQTVTVGDPGNSADIRYAPNTPGYKAGAVSYVYRIGKFEVTVEQYATFLNSAAAVTSQNGLLNLWHPAMDRPMFAGIRRTGSGTSVDPYQYTVVGNGRYPIGIISWFDAARFCNWLHNGAINTADTETGAYTLNGATNGNIDKNPNAKWWIPSLDEWWKAAYYKGGGTNTGYWTYPTRSDAPPGNSITSGTNQANYIKDGLYSVTQSSTYSSSQDYRTEVGTFSNSPSPYGTFDQGGNIVEWNDMLYSGMVTSFVGGGWPDNGGNMAAVNSAGTWDRTREWQEWGFRVAAAAVTSTRLNLEKAENLNRIWQTVPITTNMITSEGGLNLGAITNASEFYRLRIQTTTQ